MAAILAMAAIGAWAVGTHRISYVVTHGVSMHPVYYAGDLVVVMRFDSYEVGQIAAYHGDGGRLEVLHRIVGGDAQTGFVLKGDNNETVDADEPTAEDLIGRAVFHVPKIGTLIQPVLSPTGLGMLGFLFVSGGAVAAKTRRDIPRGRRKKKVKGMSGQGGGSLAMVTAIFKAVSRLHPVLRVLAYSAVIAGVLGLGLGVLGFMKPATETVTGTAKPGESMTFSYSAPVPRSAAYDDTTVYSPDPVFRKLANLVDLKMNYRGEPGRVQVDARLSAQNGWHTNLQLSQEKQFPANAYIDTVQLDLAALEQRALDAGKAIGAEMGPITLAITARIEHSDGAAFEPQLALNLAPLQLTLAGGPEALIVDRTSGGAGTTLQERQIGAFGYDVMTAAEARRYAVYLLLVAIVGAVVIAMTALRHVPLRTRAQIERRYPHLLVPVEPMASPPGKPVVMVDTFPALVKLAERYGQMILTWTRPDGADDFVVRDEGITYRFRITPESPAPTITAEAPAPPPPPVKATSKPVAIPAPPAALPAAPEAPAPEILETEEPKAPAKRARRPRPKPPEEPAAEETPAEPKPDPPAETAGDEKPAPDEKPQPKKRAPRRKPGPRKAAAKPATPEPEKDEPKKDEPENDEPEKTQPEKTEPEKTEPEENKAVEIERQAMEDLATRNETINPPEAKEREEDHPHEPIYDFLPPSKRP